ncbi:hypothetical protein BBAD15_g11784 [Beauveria bassiana D1-5]|uniref:Uncharacterized protein n=1 Tax=Beauveria bassiana D1-5 TaxID=1245745 RepID=A0A0A2V685_BEABA|nr:hypothetical protein BBAD15_g11784 [Beauveria bassiana D1-5]
MPPCLPRRQLTDIALLHPRQRRHVGRVRALAKHLHVAHALHAARAPERDAARHQSNHPQHKQRERANENDARQQPPVPQEPHDNEQKRQRHGGDGDVVREVPRHGQAQLRLHLQKGGKDAEDARRGEQHDEEPDADRPARPVVRPNVDDAPMVVDDGVGRQRGGEDHVKMMSDVAGGGGFFAPFARPILGTGWRGQRLSMTDLGAFGDNQRLNLAVVAIRTSVAA